jgi:hypothetical protein
MWNLILVHLEIVLVCVEDSWMICAKVPYAQKSFWMHPMVLLGDEAQAETYFGPFGDNANLNVR